MVLGRVTFERLGTGQTMTIDVKELADEAYEFLNWGYGDQARCRFRFYLLEGKQRPGQAFMNVLREFDLDSYVRLSGSSDDPFYNDWKIPRAMDRVTSK